MKLSVIGLGKLGSPLAAVLASKGYEVIGVDLNSDFVKKINEGRAPVDEPQLQNLITEHRTRLKATLSYQEAVLASDVTFVIVPTPSEKNGLFSNKYLLQSVEEIGRAIALKNTYHLVVITSTVTPGSCQGEIRETLEKASQREVGSNLGLCYNPEFIALGTVVCNMLYPDMILVGESDKQAGDLLETIYRQCSENTPPVRRMNLINAEITKISVNTYVTTKISYANMLSDICQHLPGSDVNVVTDAIGLDSRIGSKYLKAAVAFGGPCFPRDNVALAALANKLGARADIAIATQAINQHQNLRLLHLIEKLDNGGPIGILGLSYKPGTYVVEESQGVALANRLSSQGKKVSVFDPMALNEAKKVLNQNVEICASTFECVESADLLVILIPWPEFAKEIQMETFRKKATKASVIDCWRVLNEAAFSEVCHLIYLGVGSEVENKSLTPLTV